MKDPDSPHSKANSRPEAKTELPPRRLEVARRNLASIKQAIADGMSIDEKFVETMERAIARLEAAESGPRPRR